MKTITLVTTSFPIANDGSEAAGSFVSDLVEELAIQGCRVHVVAPGIANCVEDWKNNIRIYRYNAPPKPLSTLKPWVPRDFVWLIKVLINGQKAVLNASLESSHIFALWGFPSGEWARRIAKRLCIEYSVWVLGSDIWSLGKWPIVKQILANVIRKAKNAYADGYQLAEDAKQISGREIEFLPSTRAIITKNPPLPREQAPYRLLFLGRWHPNKGVDILLEALALLTDADWKKIETVEIFGGGPLENLVKEKVTILQQKNRPIVLGGYLNKQEAEAAIIRSDWVLIPSRIESIPVVFSDAIKLGRSVLSMPVGDLTHLVADLNTGVLVQEITAASYAKGLQQTLNTSPAKYESDIALQAKVFDLSLIASCLLEKLGLQNGK
ncbi:hypothetical protein DSM16313_26260 [Acinetobacter seohaensis]|nr:hypothetical protein DSM16313_26260 [Acinetobacter seohaensis]